MRANISIYNEDCLQAMKAMRDDEYDLAIVDPPYGLDKELKGGGNGFSGKSLNNIYRKGWDVKPTNEYFSELRRVSKNQIVWGGNYFGLPATKCFLVWDKNNGGNSMADCELAWTSFNSAVRKFTRSHIDDYNDGVIKIHPVQKPVQLYKWLLKNYASEGDLILDTHLGSGSIAIACWDLGFDLTAYEIDKDYYEGACKRLEAHKKQLQLW